MLACRAAETPGKYRTRKPPAMGDHREVGILALTEVSERAERSLATLDRGGAPRREEDQFPARLALRPRCRPDASGPNPTAPSAKPSPGPSRRHVPSR